MELMDLCSRRILAGSVQGQGHLSFFGFEFHPAGSTIVSAKLGDDQNRWEAIQRLPTLVFIELPTNGQKIQAAVLRKSAPANWNQRRTSTNWTTAGGDFNATS